MSGHGLQPHLTRHLALQGGLKLGKFFHSCPKLRPFLLPCQPVIGCGPPLVSFLILFLFIWMYFEDVWIVSRQLPLLHGNVKSLFQILAVDDGFDNSFLRVWKKTGSIQRKGLCF